MDLERAYAEHRRHVFNYFRRSGLAVSDAEDLTQAVFTTLMAVLGRFAPERGSLLAFVLGIARNHRRSHFRALGRDREPAGPERVTAGSDEILMVREALMGLPQDQREALILREYHGLTYDEIGAVQGVPVGTVRSRLSRARDQLRTRLLPKGTTR